MQIPPGAIPDKFETVMIYEKDGVQKEFTMENYPWQDTTWKFVDRKDKLVQKGNAEPKIKDFVISDQDGNNHTEEILNEPYVFLWFVKDPEDARTDNMDKLKQLAAKARELNVPFYALCSAGQEKVQKYQQEWGMMGIDWLVVDLVVNKTAMRSNPGLMLLENDVIQGK